VHAGYSEVRAALTEANYASDTGARILMAKWAAAAFVEKPLLGHGAGSFRTIAERQIAADPRAAGVRAHTQAHNTLLHVAATLGIVGVGLLGWIAYAGLMGGFRGGRFQQRAIDEPNVRAAQSDWTQIGRAYDLGPACALLGMVLVSAFDTVLVNTQQAAFVLTLAALCVPTWLRAPKRR
jgi:O-antigen ligase